jgi:hypothetical protein
LTTWKDLPEQQLKLAPDLMEVNSVN